MDGEISSKGNISYEIYWEIVTLKGYLCQKTITSQNVPSESQARVFLFRKKNYIPFSRYSNFCIFSHPMIYQKCDVMMSIST